MAICALLASLASAAAIAVIAAVIGECTDSHEVTKPVGLIAAVGVSFLWYWTLIGN